MRGRDQEQDQRFVPITVGFYPQGAGCSISEMIKEKNWNIRDHQWLLKETLEACQEAALSPHTINFSLGVWGKKERLPRRTFSQSPPCADTIWFRATRRRDYGTGEKGKIKSGTRRPRTATYCPCGIFNQVRAANS